jgi:fermentation-respiration switch protein FrsA (DUF1100 family)
MILSFPTNRASTAAHAQTSFPQSSGRRFHKAMTIILLIVEIFICSYAVILAYVAMRVEYPPPLPITKTPAAFELDYRAVTFYSREDHIRLQGWFIPGVLPDGRLTAERTLIMVHGTGSNRASPLVLSLSCALARQGFAILAFDMRGMGESAPAPLSEGYFEQRDILGAVDFLHSGPLPYPELGRSHAIAGWGDSMGAATMLLAAAREPAIRAVVSDSGFAALVPLLQSDTQYPGLMIPSLLFAVDVLYGVNFYAVRPVDVVARIAPRPIFFIQGSADTVVPPSHMQALAAAAGAIPHAHIQTWLVQGADHIESYHRMGKVYLDRVVDFFTWALMQNQRSC